MSVVTDVLEASEDEDSVESTTRETRRPGPVVQSPDAVQVRLDGDWVRHIVYGQISVVPGDELVFTGRQKPRTARIGPTSV